MFTEPETHNYCFCIILQLSYNVRFPIFWLVDLYHVTLGCDETITLTSLSWCKFNTPLSLDHGFGWLIVWRFLFAVYSIWLINRGYYTVARRYEFYILVARTISHSFASLTRKILFLPREHKIHIFEPTFDVLFIIWRNQFNKSKRRESWRHWTIRHSQRWHTENTPLWSRMKWRMESTSGLVLSKTLSSI